MLSSVLLLGALLIARAVLRTDIFFYICFVTVLIFFIFVLSFMHLCQSRKEGRWTWNVLVLITSCNLTFCKVHFASEGHNVTIRN